MKRKKTKIILTGYRATGKTSVGKILADRLLFRFIDTDQGIEKKKGQSISNMVSDHGWEYFRAAERDFLASLLPEEKLVIAPGGGAILHQEVWEKLMETSLVVWLQADVHTIAQRLGADNLSLSQRPSLTGEDVIQEVKSVLAVRGPLYKNGSHYTVSTEKPLAAIVDEILGLWEKCQQE
ncbi:MAG: shikimate kinase [Deltaproteobacteria bacterium]|nr:shikimate kinase [Deltaproteobacteria bacterium]